MYSVEATCTCLCGFEMEGRHIWLVTMDDGNLGIMVKDAKSAAVLPLDPNLPGMSETSAPRVIFGAMGLLALIPAWDQSILIACVDTALIMTTVEKTKDQREMLLCIYDKEGARDIQTSAWRDAVQLAAQVFSHADRELVTNLYIFTYSDPTITMH